jgi:hypothetical protein
MVHPIHINHSTPIPFAIQPPRARRKFTQITHLPWEIGKNHPATPETPWFGNAAASDHPIFAGQPPIPQSLPSKTHRANQTKIKPAQTRSGQIKPVKFFLRRESSPAIRELLEEKSAPFGVSEGFSHIAGIFKPYAVPRRISKSCPISAPYISGFRKFINCPSTAKRCVSPLMCIMQVVGDKAVIVEWMSCGNRCEARRAGANRAQIRLFREQ